MTTALTKRMQLYGRGDKSTHLGGHDVAGVMSGTLYANSMGISSLQMEKQETLDLAASEGAGLFFQDASFYSSLTQMIYWCKWHVKNVQIRHKL